MKYQMTGRLAATAFAALMLGACATSSGHTKAENTNDRFQKAKDLLAQTKTQVDASMDAANNLVDPSTTDSVAAYNRFAKAVGEMKKRAEKLKEGIAEADKSLKEYFAAWEKEGSQITDPDLRRASVERRTQHYGATQQMLVTVNSASNGITEFLKTLEDAKRFANFNMTPESVATLQPIVDRAARQADSVKGDLDAAVLHIDEAAQSTMN